jgi:hypothetical protein
MMKPWVGGVSRGKCGTHSQWGAMVTHTVVVLGRMLTRENINCILQGPCQHNRPLTDPKSYSLTQVFHNIENDLKLDPFHPFSERIEKYKCMGGFPVLGKKLEENRRVNQFLAEFSYLCPMCRVRWHERVGSYEKA